MKQLANLEGILVDATAYPPEGIGLTFFEGLAVTGKAVLVRTDWSKHWNTAQYFEGHPFLTAEAAEWLKDEKAGLVGIDAHNIDNSATKRRPVHSILLGAEIPIVEHLCNLKALSGKQFRFSAVPPKIKGMGTFPVRAYARTV